MRHLNGWSTQSAPVGTHGYSRVRVDGKLGQIIQTFTKIEEDLWNVDGDKFNNERAKRVLDNESTVSFVVGIIEAS